MVRRIRIRGVSSQKGKINMIRKIERVPVKGMKQGEQETTVRQDILYLLLKIVVTTAVLMFVFTFLFGICRNSDVSMYPAVKEGDLVIFYRLDKSYTAGDCVVVEYKGNEQIRRIAAVAGDTVDITEDGLVINGTPQMEMAIYEETNRYAEGIGFPVVVSEGEIFVFGDSRKNAADSRIYGCVSVKDTLGKVITIIRRREI